MAELVPTPIEHGEDGVSEKARVIVTRKLPDQVETRLMELFDTCLNLDDTPMTQEELTAAVQRCDILVPTVTDNIDAGVIDEAGLDLKLMANFGVGVNLPVEISS